MADYDYYVRFNPGTDVALLNGMMHIIIRERLYDEQFIEERTEQFDQLRGGGAALYATRGSAPDRCLRNSASWTSHGPAARPSGP